MPVEICATDYDDLSDADAKLLRLAKELGGKVITNDFNLNKVAAVQGVAVLNVNELANAVKPVLLPGRRCACASSKRAETPRRAWPTWMMERWSLWKMAEAASARNLLWWSRAHCKTAAGRMIFARDPSEV